MQRMALLNYMFMIAVNILMNFNFVSGNETKDLGYLEMFPIGSPERCYVLLGRKVSTFEVLPGFGWDNLANEELGQAFDYQYKKCKLTGDGVYLIPDSVNVIPTKESNVGLYAELMDSMKSYKSVTSSSINGHVSAGIGLDGFEISGSFDAGHGNTKVHMAQSDSRSIISRVSAKYNRYKVTVQPDAPLSAAFRNRVLHIAKSYQLNDHSMGRYLSQLFVRDFGTHVITSLDAGASYVKEDVIKINSSSDMDSLSKGLQIGAAISFGVAFPTEAGVLSISAQFGIGTDDKDFAGLKTAYAKQVSHSTVTTFGGAVINPSNPGNGSWSDSLKNNLVAIDRRGQTIQELITPSNFPEIPQSLVVDTQNAVRDAFVAYYKHNTYRGCTDPMAKNFDITANVDSGACESTAKENLFGGAYQTCVMIESNSGDICPDHQQRNPLTGVFRCPSGYSSVPLISHYVSKPEFKTQCRDFWGWKCCTTVYTGKYSLALTQSHWCAPDDIQSGSMKMYFGGIYTSTRSNDLTSKQSCPGNDSQVITIMNDVHICLESSPVDSYGFGGMFSCQNGNKMAAKHTNNTSVDNGRMSYPKSCPPQYSQKFLKLVDDCQVEFCSNLVERKKSGNLPALKRPPFINHPHPNKDVPPHADLIILNNNGDWFKNEAAYEQIAKLQDLNSKLEQYKTSFDSLNELSLSWPDLASIHSPSDSASTSSNASPSSRNGHLSTPTIAIIATLATVCCILVASLVVILRRQRAGTQSRGVYQPIKTLPTADTGRENENEANDVEINTSIFIQPNSYGSSD